MVDLEYLPWNVEIPPFQSPAGGTARLVDTHGQIVAEVYEADEGAAAEVAASVANRLNAHDALVVALEKFSRSETHMNGSSHCFCANPPKTPDVAQHSTRCTAARAALALARGEVQP